MRVAVGDGLVVPEDREAVLEVVHQLAELGTVGGRVELAVHAVPHVPVLAEGRRGVGVAHRRADLDVVLGALGGLGLDLLADRRLGADLAERVGGVGAQVVPVLHRLEGRGAHDEDGDEDAHAHDGQAASVLRLRLLGADGVDDRLTVGLCLLGHGALGLSVDCWRGSRWGCGGRVYVVAGETRHTPSVVPSSGPRLPRIDLPAVGEADRLDGGAVGPVGQPVEGRLQLRPRRRARRRGAGPRPPRPALVRRPRGRPTRTGRARRDARARRRPARPRRAAAPGRPARGRRRPGRPASLPCTSSAAPAISSATAGRVTASGLP